MNLEVWGLGFRVYAVCEGLSSWSFTNTLKHSFEELWWCLMCIWRLGGWDS